MTDLEKFIFKRALVIFCGIIFCIMTFITGYNIAKNNQMQKEIIMFKVKEVMWYAE